jgi:hypothetical protein
MGNFGTHTRNFAAPSVRRHDPVKTSQFSAFPVFLAGADLAPMDGEPHVFRTALLSIVLTLAVGQNASLLCKAWCPDATSAGCRHQESTTSPSVSADDNCGDTFVGPVALVREDARRTAAPDAQNALVVQRFQLAPSPADLRPGFESGQRRPLEARPLVITLRI